MSHGSQQQMNLVLLIAITALFLFLIELSMSGVNVFSEKSQQFNQLYVSIFNSNVYSNNRQSRAAQHQRQVSKYKLHTKRASTALPSAKSENFDPKANISYVTVNSRGRLGNQMFIYATLLGAAAHNHKLAYRRNTKRFTWKLSMFHNLSVPLWSTAAADRIESTLTSISEGVCCKYNAKLMTLQPHQNYVLDGYLQSWRYFDGVADQLRKFDFAFHDIIAEQCTKVIKNALWESRKIQPKDCVLVGTHMRRGDMVALRMYTAANAGYMLRAIKFMRDKLQNSTSCLQFLVIGDDFQWNMKHAPKTADVSVISTNSPEIDMCILAHCQHTIMSVGTFGWWGAYLANGITVYQKDFAPAHSTLHSQFNVKDYFLPDWVPM